MNKIFFEFALAKITALTTDDIARGLSEAGIPFLRKTLSSDKPNLDDIVSNEKFISIKE